MKNFYTLVSLILLLTACSDPALKKVREISQKAKKAEVYFYSSSVNAKDQDTFTKTLDKQVATDFLETISKKSAPDYSCSSDGMIRFIHSQGQPVCIHFTTAPSCSHVTFRLNGYAYSKKIDSEGVKQLQNFKSQTSLK